VVSGWYRRLAADDRRESADLAGLAWLWAEIGGLLPMIGGRVLI